MTDAAMGGPGSGDADPLRDQLLTAATRVFAERGYAGTKIQDIVREAGVSTGAVYGRFRSKDDLLRQAVVTAASRATTPAVAPGARVADLIEAGAALSSAPLSDDQAVRLEAFVTARREPEVASAVADAIAQARVAVQPLVDAAIADGTVGRGVDPEAVLFFVRTMQLGLLLQRAAGQAGPDQASWSELISRIVASFGDHDERRTR